MQAKAKSQVLKNTIILFAGQMITLALSVVSAFYIPRRIGPTGTGELALAGALTSLVGTLGALGTWTLMVRDIARDRRKAPEVVGVAILTRGLLSLPTLAIIIGIAWLAGYTPETQLVIYIVALGMVLRMLTAPFQAGFQALERMKYNSLGAVIGEAIITFASVGVVLTGRGVIPLSIVGLGAALVILVLNVIWWRRVSPTHMHFNFRLMRYLVVGGLPFWATGIFLTIYLYVDSLMLSFLTNTQVVGWYSVPTKLFGLLLFIPTIVGTAIFPALARTYKSAPREMVKLARRSFNLLTCLSLPIAVGGTLLAKQVILMLYGPKFGASIPIMMVLSAMIIPTYLNILVNQFLVATERQIMWTKVMAAACVVNPLLNLWLITYYQKHHSNGAFGAAWALLITEGLMTIAGIVILPRGILGWSNLVSIVKSCAAAGLMALAVWYTLDYFIIVPIVTGAVVYLVAAVALGALTRQDFQLLEPLAAKVLGKVGVKRVAPRTDMEVA